MSIYVAISSLEDAELPQTVFEAVRNAYEPSGVTVGVAFHSSSIFYERAVDGFGHMDIIKNVKPMFFNRNDKVNIGIGIGRKNALSAYSNQDIVVQVDSHTKFEKGWDKQIIRLYEDAIKETGNSDTVVTGFPGSYITDSLFTRELVDPETRYCVWSNEAIAGANPMQRWRDIPLKHFPPHLIQDGRMFFPANKVSGAFLISNGRFAKDNCLPTNSIFFEEELLQTINLLSAGYSLVFPHIMSPISHYYENTMAPQYTRQTVFNELMYSDESINGLMQSNYYDFINNVENKEKCKMFEEWSGFSLNNGFSKPYYIPDSYNY